MAQCITVDETGSVIAVASPASECPGYVLLTGAEYVAVSVSQGVFAMPTVEETATWFTGPLMTIVFFYVLGKIIGSVVNMFR